MASYRSMPPSPHSKRSLGVPFPSIDLIEWTTGLSLVFVTWYENKIRIVRIYVQSASNSTRLSRLRLSPLHMTIFFQKLGIKQQVPASDISLTISPLGERPLFGHWHRMCTRVPVKGSVHFPATLATAYSKNLCNYLTDHNFKPSRNSDQYTIFKGSTLV